VGERKGQKTRRKKWFFLAMKIAITNFVYRVLFKYDYQYNLCGFAVEEKNAQCDPIATYFWFGFLCFWRNFQKLR